VGKVDDSVVVDAIVSELDGTGSHLGYRSMHDRLLKIHHIHTDRETVRRILKVLDPEAVYQRKQRRLKRRTYSVQGPNSLWHIDGWDKLKKFGLCVHGAIDGFSRRILWLEVGPTNNNPFVVCHYFALTVKKLGGLPSTIRADKGTENVNVERLQVVLRSSNIDESARLGTTFLYGKSTHNQRIEAWWSKFRMYGMESWMQHLQSLSDNGIIDTSKALDVQCIRFCYTNLLREELQNIAKLWNTHYVRCSQTHNTQGGRPDVLFYMPELYGKQDYLKDCDESDLTTLEELLAYDVPDCEEPYFELFTILMAESSKSSPQNLSDAADILVYLLDSVDE
jgi:hypothetical protein